MMDDHEPKGRDDALEAQLGAIAANPELAEEACKHPVRTALRS
jgi:hypothetical protein